MRGSVFTLLGGLLLAAAGCAGTPPAGPIAPRSVVIVTIDTLRADHVREDVAPSLMHLARESLVFEQAVTVSPTTLSSHASLLTGAYPVRHGVRDNMLYTLAQGVPSFAESFKRQGYATGAFVSAIVLDHRHGLGRGFDVYDDEVGETERSASDTLARARRWLDGVSPSPSKPFFLWIHLFEPHAPYRAGSYAAEVTAVDAELGRFFDGLRTAGRWADTVVSVTADHGEMLGEHGEKTHGFFLYESAIRIPWLLKAPGLATGRFPHQVRIVDVLPTVLTLATGPATSGIEPTSIDGVDLTPHLRENSPPRLEAYSETFLPRNQFGWSELQSVRLEGSKLIQGSATEMFDLGTDPSEQHNLVGQRQDLQGRLSNTLAGIRRVSAPSSKLASEDPLLRERFMSLGYLGYSPATSGGAGSALADPRSKLPVYLLLMEATELISTRRDADAIARADAAIALDAAVAQAHFLKATALGNLKRFREAVAALERTLALNPRHVAARFKLAIAQVQVGDTTAARHTLEQVLAHEPDNVRAWHNLAAIVYTQQEYARAAELERKAVAIDPDYVEAWNTLGAIAIVQKRPAEAVEALERASRLAPANAQVMANLALAYDASGRTADADRAARRACELDKRYCEANR